MQLLDAYLDGETDLTAALEIETHLSECAECRQRLAEKQKLIDTIREKATCFQAPGHLKTRILATLKEQSGEKVSGWKFFQHIRFGFAGAVIAGLVLCFLIIPRPGATLTGEAVAAHVRSLQVNHLMDVASTDQHTVKPWFAGKLDYSPQVIDLASAGFPLTGGRLDVLDHRQVAAIVYQRRKHYINLFIWPADGSRLSRPLYSEHGYQILGWSKSGMNYLAVSDVQEQDFQSFVNLIQEHLE